MISTNQPILSIEITDLANGYDSEAPRHLQVT